MSWKPKLARRAITWYLHYEMHRSRKSRATLWKLMQHSPVHRSGLNPNITCSVLYCLALLYITLYCSSPAAREHLNTSLTLLALDAPTPSPPRLCTSTCYLQCEVLLPHNQPASVATATNTTGVPRFGALFQAPATSSSNAGVFYAGWPCCTDLGKTDA